MRPLADWPLVDRRRLIGVFTDIDDTLTTEGAITQDALAALGNLKTAGLHVIAITGRPAGWSEPFAYGDAPHGLPAWPVDAIVAENGAVALLGSDNKTVNQNARSRSSSNQSSLSKIYQQDASTRTTNAKRLQSVAAQILRDIPTARLAQDSAGRETDIAIDHSEFAHLPPAQIDQTVAIMHAAGMNASVSSIHINGWFGDHDKLSGARWIVQRLFGRGLDAEIDRWAFVGDSTNDQTMFRAFGNSVGVANIARFAAELQHAPTYLATAERGAGFAQVVAAVLAARSSAAPVAADLDASMEVTPHAPSQRPVTGTSSQIGRTP